MAYVLLSGTSMLLFLSSQQMVGTDHIQELLQLLQVFSVGCLGDRSLKQDDQNSHLVQSFMDCQMC